MLNRWLLMDRAAARAGGAWLDDEDRSWSPWFLPSDDVGPLKLIVGTPGNDDLHGTSGDDTIDGLQGTDQMAGRKGNDTYVVDNIGDTVIEQAHQGQDVVMAAVSYTLGANVEHIGLTGTGDINATGNELDNRLYGNVGANELDGKEGADTMVGGAGDDLYCVDNPGDVVREHHGEGTDTVRVGIDYTLGKNEENLSLRPDYPSTGLVGTGNELANVITDYFGNDVLYGLAGNDTLDGGRILSPGNYDTLYGGDGDDLLQAGQHEYSGDLLHGGMGNDTLQVGLGANDLFGDEGDDLLIAGAGGMYHGPSDFLNGGSGNDTLQGGTGMSGGDGNDLLQISGSGGGAGGGAGNDTIEGSGGGGDFNLSVDGGPGQDLIDVTSINELRVRGGGGDDTISGGGSYMKVDIDGGAGDDYIVGFKYQPSEMALLGGDGNDTIFGSGSGLGFSISGGNGRDTLTASAANGTPVDVYGDSGADTLHATAGIATLHGGDGADQFILSAKEMLGETMFTVADFASDVDQLSISQSSLEVGNGDLTVDGAIQIDGPGGFDTCSELVIVAADIFGDLSLDKAAAAIGSANQAYAIGQTVVFTVDNGADSWVLYFQSAGADAAVSAAELSIVGRLNGTASTGAEDLIWSA